MKSWSCLIAGVVCALLAGAVFAGSFPALINYQGRLHDSSGAPVEASGVAFDFSMLDKPVTTEPFEEGVKMGGTVHVSLSHSNIMENSEVVISSDGSVTYEQPRDYVMDYAKGTIARVSGGMIVDGQKVTVKYDWISYGTLLWKESQFLDVYGGLYQTALGLVEPVPASVFSEGSVYLEVVIDGETLSPRTRLTSTPYAMNSVMLSGHTASDFASAVHGHDFAQISGTASDSQVPDDITIVYAQDAGALGGMTAGNYLNSSGDTVTGDMHVLGSVDVGSDLYVAGDAAVMGGNIGIGRAAHSSYGIANEAASAPYYGAYMYGNNYGVIGRLASDPDDHYGYLGSLIYGVYGKSGNSDETGVRYGGRFIASSQGTAYGVSGLANGYSVNSTYGVYGNAGNSSSGNVRGLYGYAYKGAGSGDIQGVYGSAQNMTVDDAYGGYFNASSEGTGTHYGVYAEADHYGVYAEADNYPLLAANSRYPYDYYARLGTMQHGINAECGKSSDTSSRYGGRFYGYSSNSAYGISAIAHGYGTYASYGVRGTAYQDGTGNAYGLYGSASAPSGTAYGLYVFSGTKNWVNPDPEDPEKSIAYVTVESGENVTYLASRGELVNGMAEITLPDHFRKVTSPEHPVMVQLTPRSAESLGLAVVESGNAGFTVVELMGGTGSYEFDYTVKGMRLGYEDYEPVIDNVDYVPFEGNHENLDPSEMTTQEWYDAQSPGLKRIFKANGTLDKDGKVNGKAFEARGWKMVTERAPKKEHPRPVRPEHPEHPEHPEPPEHAPH
ncbi:MAG: hypothetical protein R6V10_06270 [bacterium]